MRSFAAGLTLILASVSAAPELAAQSAQERKSNIILDRVQPPKAETLAAFRRYQNMRSAIFQSWLPDGSMLIKTRFGDIAQIHRVAFPGGAREQLTFSTEPARNALASPTENLFLTSRDVGGNEAYQGYMVRNGGPEVQFTDPGTRNEAFIFSRDGKRVAWTRATPGKADWEIIVASTADSATRTIVPIGLGIVAPLDFSPDGSKLLLLRRLSSTAAERHILDLASGTTRQLNPTSKAISYWSGRFSRDGNSVILQSDMGGEFMKLVRIRLSDNRVTPLSAPNLQWDVEALDLIGLSAFELSPDGRAVAYTVNQDGRSVLHVADAATGRALATPDLGDVVITRLRFSPDSKQLAIGISRSDVNSDVFVWNLRSRKLVRWTFSEQGGLATDRLPAIQLLHAPSFDGVQIPAFAYRPKQPKPGRMPVIILVHGGPEAQMRPAFDATISHFVEQLGAVVITPNIRGSTGYGRRFTMLDDGPKREDSVRDIEGLLNWIATQPDLDTSRVAIMGASYGGYVSLASLAKYSDRLVGAIDEFGISNWQAFFAAVDESRRGGRRGEYGDERDPATRAFFDRISPTNMTASMTKPLLVVTGANDPNVPKSESDNIVAKLRQDGKDVRYLVGKDEGHGFRKKDNQDVMIAVETEFLAELFGRKP